MNELTHLFLYGILSFLMLKENTSTERIKFFQMHSEVNIFRFEAAAVKIVARIL